jgi:hypothetical protein
VGHGSARLSCTVRTTYSREIGGYSGASPDQISWRTVGPQLGAFSGLATDGDEIHDTLRFTDPNVREPRPTKFRDEPGFYLPAPELLTAHCRLPTDY